MAFFAVIAALLYMILILVISAIRVLLLLIQLAFWLVKQPFKLLNRADSC